MDPVRAIFEDAPLPYVVVDDAARVIHANRAARALFGDGSILAPLSNVDVSSVTEREVRAITADGRVRELIVRRDHLGNGLHLVAFREAATQKSTDDSGYSALSAVHDINNLLTPIAAYATALEAELIDERQREMAHEIVVTTLRAAEVVRSVLGSVRTRARASAPVSLNEVVIGIRSLIERLLGADIELTYSLEPNLALTQLDRLELERAILNLVSNARDAMGKRGRLTIETANVERPLAEEGHRGSQVMLRVSDTGIGMSEAVRAHVLDRPASHKSDGSGLGLVTVRRLIASSGGLFTIESTAGHGTSVALFFRAS
jgi:two-component system cell cycle sensor histidine kinase/response regulator CckA